MSNKLETKCLWVIGSTFNDTMKLFIKYNADTKTGFAKFHVLRAYLDIISYLCHFRCEQFYRLLGKKICKYSMKLNQCILWRFSYLLVVILSLLSYWFFNALPIYGSWSKNFLRIFNILRILFVMKCLNWLENW